MQIIGFQVIIYIHFLLKLRSSIASWARAPEYFLILGCVEIKVGKALSQTTKRRMIGQVNN